MSVVFVLRKKGVFPVFREKKVFFLFFVGKWTPTIKTIKKTVLVSPDVSLTSVVIRQRRLPFCDMKLTLFCESTTSGLLPDVFQDNWRQSFTTNQDTGSFTHTSSVVCRDHRDVIHGGPGISTLIFRVPHHCMTYDSLLNQGCSLILVRYICLLWIKKIER